MLTSDEQKILLENTRLEIFVPKSIAVTQEHAVSLAAHWFTELFTELGVDGTIQSTSGKLEINDLESAFTGWIVTIGLSI